MAPVVIRDLRRMLRYRNLVVRQTTRMKNRIAGLLMETGTAYNKERLHGKAYFSELLGGVCGEVPLDGAVAPSAVHFSANRVYRPRTA